MLSGSLLFQEKYDKGIEIFEKLKDSEDYIGIRYEIYFSLSTFYIGKANKTAEKERGHLIKKAEEYLSLGFNNSPEKALAYYKRGMVYSAMKCMEKAKIDLQEAINTAKTKELIYFEEGVYLNKERFIEFVTKVMDSLGSLEDSCMLEEGK